MQSLTLVTSTNIFLLFITASLLKENETKDTVNKAVRKNSCQKFHAIVLSGMQFEVGMSRKSILRRSLSPKKFKTFFFILIDAKFDIVTSTNIKIQLPEVSD